MENPPKSHGPSAAYRVVLVEELSPRLVPGRTQPSWMTSPTTAAGDQLMAAGLQPPVLHPETALVLELERDR